MILNLIPVTHQIPLTTGMVGILGTNAGRVTIIAIALGVEGNILPHMEHFAKNVILTHLEGDRRDMIIFEVNLRDELRNPRRLLMSIRGKLKQAMLRAEQKMHQDLHDYLNVPDHCMPCAMPI